MTLNYPEITAGGEVYGLPVRLSVLGMAFDHPFTWDISEWSQMTLNYLGVGAAGEVYGMSVEHPVVRFYHVYTCI